MKLLRKSLFFLLITVIVFINPLSSRIFTLIVSLVDKIETPVFYNLIAAESSFRCFAYSHRKSIGLGQLQRTTYKYIAPDLPTSLIWFPLVNLHVSAKYLHYLKKKYNHNWTLVLAAYNWGESNVDAKISLLKIRLTHNQDYSHLFSGIPETSNFIKRVMKK